MRIKTKHLTLTIAFLLFSAIRAESQESPLHAELRRAEERLGEACNFSFRSVPMCGYTLFTDHPLHIAAGSLPPQNGFGLGAAFVWSKNTENWRLSWDLDAVGATSGAWRAGGYMNIIHTPRQQIRVAIPKPGEKQKLSEAFVHPYTIFNLYAQSISLNKVNFFGLGNDSSKSGASVFGMSQTIVGASVIKPVFEWPAIRKLNLAVLGELNGRFVDIRGENGQSVPSIEALYTNATAPGLASQPGFVQLSEGFRIKPVIGDYLELNYVGTFRQFFAPSNSSNSFLRWAADLNHTFYIYGYTRAAQAAPRASDASGPDSCGPAALREQKRGRSGQETFDERCPAISRTRNLNGSVNLRLFVSESINSASSAVPFYFQPTLGGQDINNELSLGSYQDYRFRAPNVLLLQESFEHSIWGPFGVKLMADQGRVALMRSDLGFSHLKHSFAAGLTLRAGAFPMVSLMFAWGGSEGQHTIANMNTSLLGGSSRPVLD